MWWMGGSEGALWGSVVLYIAKVRFPAIRYRSRGWLATNDAYLGFEDLRLLFALRTWVQCFILLNTLVSLSVR